MATGAQVRACPSLNFKGRKEGGLHALRREMATGAQVRACPSFNFKGCKGFMFLRGDTYQGWPEPYINGVHTDFWQENHQIYGHIRRTCTVLANPTCMLSSLIFFS